MISANSSGSIRPDSGVESTRSQNMTLICRRSACAAALVVSPGRNEAPHAAQ
jgi:hypothetical protein